MTGSTSSPCDPIMATISLTDEELAVVRHALGAYLSDLRMEVHATDSYDMREELKHEEAVINRVLEEIDSHLPGSGTTA